MCFSLSAFLRKWTFLFFCLLPMFSLLCFSWLQLLFSKLQSFNSNVLFLFFLISSWFDPWTFSHLSAYLVMTHITPWLVHFCFVHLYFLTSKIVTLLILNRTSLLYASPSRPTLDNALDQACSQYISSDTHNAVKEQFLLPPKQYSILQFTKFVLSHRFW